MVKVWVAITVAATAGSDPAWRDPSPHQVRFVAVEDDVRLEVLDWGGSGRPVVLLAGFGNSAHVFDDFAPGLVDYGHVYAITRRGHGASSQPAAGYDDQGRADDVLRVLDSLRIEAPVLVGHSVAGDELTTLGRQHSDRLAGLVYLDALRDPRGDPPDPGYGDLVRNLRPPPPCPRGSTSLSAYQAWQRCSQRLAFPESELRQTLSINPDGTIGPHLMPPRVRDAIGEGQRKRDYSGIRVPVLALVEYPLPADASRPADEAPRNEQERAALAAFTSATNAMIDRWVAAFRRGLPAARVVEMPGAGHYVFLTREAQVQRELRAFLAGLPAFAQRPLPSPRN